MQTSFDDLMSQLKHRGVNYHHRHVVAPVAAPHRSRVPWCWGDFEGVYGRVVQGSAYVCVLARVRLLPAAWLPARARECVDRVTHTCVNLPSFLRLPPPSVPFCPNVVGLDEWLIIQRGALTSASLLRL